MAAGNDPPVFASGITRTVPENSDAGTPVGAPVTASDPGDSLTYTLAGASEFEIVRDTGQIQVASGAVLDYETTPSYMVAVTARDSGNLTASTTVTINLTDVDEPVVPVFSEESYTRSVHENAAAGTPVGAPVQASAPGQALSYSISGQEAGSFTVDTNTGQLRVAGGAVLDHETKSSYSLTVTAADPGGLTAVAIVRIRVVDLDEIGDLGTVEFVIGSSGDSHGYVQGSYGTLSSGDFPEELFESGADRTVQEFREVVEDGTTFWYLRYQSGTADAWLSDDDKLNAVLVKVSYEGGTDGREFVLGGFIAERQSSNRLKLEPPVPSRDFESRGGETVRVEFVRHIAQANPAVMSRIIPPIPRQTPWSIS